MSNKNKSTRNLKLQATAVREGTGTELPDILQQNTRSGSVHVDPLLDGVKVERVYELGTEKRGGLEITDKSVDTAEHELLAIEAEDGTTIFIRADKLAEDIERIRPEAIIDGEIDFANFRDPNAVARGVGDIFWKAVSVLRLPADGLLKEAEKLAKEWAKEKFDGNLEGKAYDLGSTLGAKALIWKIESRLAGNPGLYHWHNEQITSTDLCKVGDPRLKEASAGEPMLLMVHGTASYTLGSFEDLFRDTATWRAFQEKFSGGIFGYEHRTFSQSPIENALEIVNSLPDNARISLLTHSRGGLVGDLLCLGQVNPAIIDSYVIDTTDAEDAAGLELEAEEERQRLHSLVKTLRDKNLVIENYVRVACPARGTRILSDNLDAALSDFMNLIQVGGSALMGVVAGAIGGPAAAASFGSGTSSAIGVLKRLVLEIAGRRIDPRYIPGLAAMRIDSPLAGFLAHPETRRHDSTNMAVIAGDTEFDSLGFSDFRRRIANLFCDWRLFDQHNNDLVVDTDSMYAGLGFREGASYLYDQDSTVTHFRYFKNQPSREALRTWLVEDEASKQEIFTPLTQDSKTSWKLRDQTSAKRGISGPKPVVIIIPGIMGTHIEVNRRTKDRAGSGNRIWFDILSIGFGKLSRIADVTSEKIVPEDIFERFYGDLVTFLEDSHHVIRCPYDWRKPLDAAAKELEQKIKQAEENQPGQPIRLLAHSMGGLVSRTLMQRHPGAWNKVINSGGQLIMLGTPNNGSHLMAHTLLGKSDSIRKLAKVDLSHNLQEILDIVGGFPGALSLLPGPGFNDTGSEPRIRATEFYKSSVWSELRELNRDRWHGDKVAGVAEQKLLTATKKFWDRINKHQPPHMEQVSYVYGQAEKTACGVIRDSNNKLKLLFTAEGDGSVTWESGGQLENLNEERCWFMPVEHGDLASVEEFFPALSELLDKGTSSLLERLPRKRGAVTPGFILEAPPPVIPNEEELARSIMGSSASRKTSSRKKQVLKISVRAGDLRFINRPLICGHYIGDAISGAEAALDRTVNGQLSHRHRLGVYVDEVSTSSIVMLSPNSEELQRNTRRGAIIIGLGEMNGRLSSGEVTESVRAGVLHLLLRSMEVPAECGTESIKISSLLIGQNSSSNITINESLVAVVRGICEANAKFSCESTYVSEVEFIELYLDTAITAAHAIKDLPLRLANDLSQMNMRLEPASELLSGEGSRHRLYASQSGGHWPRLIVADADRNEENCPAECYQARNTSPIPEAVLEELLGQNFRSLLKKDKDEKPAGAQHNYPERLRYVLIAERARTESIALQRQPGLIESIVSKQVTQSRYNSKLSRTLFELMVPLDYKAVARETSRLVLQLDGYTANLPWELLQADKNEPMAIKTAMVRQLSTTRFRRNVRSAPEKTACIIVDPSTEGYADCFPGSRQKELPRLGGAVKEGKAIREKLIQAGYLNGNIAYSPPEAEALDVLHHLLHRPHRVLVISAHGIFQTMHEDGQLRSGVVLSGGSLLTATEIGQMEVVPELVFLNCCHLAQISTGTALNRLAYSISRELIEMGVRCIIAAGWAVDDQAACTFAESFFDEMLNKNEQFGEAVFNARRVTYNKHRGSNTWGAYQAYGDPDYRLAAANTSNKRSTPRITAVDELLHALNQKRLEKKDRDFKPVEAKVLTEELSPIRQAVPVEWLHRADVLETFGKVYADIASDGFEKAREFYLQAIAREDKFGVVAIKTIEQLANMEARTGATKGGSKGESMVRLAIKRLEALRSVSATSSRNQILNAERAALLGSAYKRLACVMLQNGKSWASIRKILVNSAEAYQEALGPAPATTPYNTLNYLLLALLAGLFKKEDLQEQIELAHLCADTARKNYAADGDFFSAVMPADALVTAWLLGDKIKGNAGLTLTKSYEDCLEGVAKINREMNSVIDNLHLLAQLIRHSRIKVSRASVLNAVAREIDPHAAIPVKAKPVAKKKSPKKTRTTVKAKKSRRTRKQAPKSKRK